MDNEQSKQEKFLKTLAGQLTRRAGLLLEDAKAKQGKGCDTTAERTACLVIVSISMAIGESLAEND